MAESKSVEEKPKEPKFLVKAVRVELIYADEFGCKEETVSFFTNNIQELSLSQHRDVKVVGGEIVVGKDNVFSLTVNYQR